MGERTQTRMNASVFSVFVAKYDAVRGCFPVALPNLPKLFLLKRIRFSEVHVPTRVPTFESFLRKTQISDRK
jgi:hypothetical protein